MCIEEMSIFILGGDLRECLTDALPFNTLSVLPLCHYTAPEPNRIEIESRF